MISLIVPSARPAGLRRFIESAFDTAGHGSQVGVVAVIDKGREKEFGDLSRDGAYRVLMVSSKRQRYLSEYWNIGAKNAWRTSSLYMMGADDVEFVSRGWAIHLQNVTDMLGDVPTFLYGDDGNHHHRLGTHGFINRAWYQTTGEFTHGGFTRDYADTYLNVIAAEIGRRIYLPDIVTLHHHPIFGTAPDDEVYASRRPEQAVAKQEWHNLMVPNGKVQQTIEKLARTMQ